MASKNQKPIEQAEDFIILDEYIGQEPHQIRVRADLRYFPEDQRDYYAKLRAARGIPNDDNSITPDDPLIKIVAQDAYIASMPESTQAEKMAKNQAILTTIAQHYEKHREQALSDAVILAITIDNEFVEEPTEYEDPPTPRRRPGLVDLPAPKRDLRNPVERRLKQVYDQLAKSPMALAQLQQLTSSLAVEIGRRMQMVDRDGFRGG